MYNQNMLYRGGFSLLESLLAIASASIILLAAVTFVLIYADMQTKQRVAADADQEGAAAARIITQTIRNARAITMPSAGTSGSSLSLEMSDASATPTTFSLDNGALRITEGVQTAQPITSSRVRVSDLAFTNLSGPDTPGVIRISFVIRSVNPDTLFEYEDSVRTFTASASLR